MGHSCPGFWKKTASVSVNYDEIEWAGAKAGAAPS